MPANKVIILVVDDDMRILRMIQRTLELEGYKVLVASDGRTALKVFDEEAPDLVLLDIMLPDQDGYAVCQRMREFSHVPIIMVTAKGGDEEKVHGLDSGADDYISKPFSARELAARVRAALRRAALVDKHHEPLFCSQDLVIDFAAHKVTIGGQAINLTATEYKLLSYMANNADRVVIPDQMLERVWGDKYLGETHLLQVSIARLRHKLGDDAKNPKYILTRPGIGYILTKSHD